MTIGLAARQLVQTLDQADLVFPILDRLTVIAFELKNERPALFAQDCLMVWRHFLQQALQLHGERPGLSGALLLVEPEKQLVVQGADVVPQAAFPFLLARRFLFHGSTSCGPGCRPAGARNGRLKTCPTVASLWQRTLA